MANGAVLVGYEPGDNAQDAVALARVVAGAMDCELIVANVQIISAFGIADYMLPDALREAGANVLTPVTERLRQNGLRVHAEPAVSTSAARGLYALAEREKPEVVVVGSSHRGRVGRALAGTVGQRLLHGSPCPVAIAPKGWSGRSEHRLARIGVGFDGEDEAVHALGWAQGLARGAGAAIEVIAVARVPQRVYAAEAAAYAQVDLDRAAREHAAENLDRALGLMPEGVGSEGSVLEGAAAQALEEATRRLDLLVVGSRAYGPLWRVLLGSVSAHLVAHAACPLIVVPRRGE